MTDEQFRAYSEKLDALQERVKALRFDDFTLTDAEQEMLDTMPQEYLDAMAEALARYAPSSQDMREDMARKAFAVFMLEVMPVQMEAVRLGWRAA